MIKVGVIGAGLMGTAITQRLLGAGFEVLAYDVDAAKREAIAKCGAKPQATAAGVIAGCEINVLAVFNTDQVEEVIEGPGGGVEAIGQGAGARVFIVTSTCDPDRLSALAQRVAPRGARILEVPISGTSRQVAQGQGVGLVGGDRDVMEAAASVLDAICPRRHYLGAVGNGSRAKLAVNLILGLNRAALAEGLALASALGLDRVAFLEVARGSAAYSQVMDVKGGADGAARVSQSAEPRRPEPQGLQADARAGARMRAGPAVRDRVRAHARRLRRARRSRVGQRRAIAEAIDGPDGHGPLRGID